MPKAASSTPAPTAKPVAAKPQVATKAPTKAPANPAPAPKAEPPKAATPKVPAPGPKAAPKAALAKALATPAATVTPPTKAGPVATVTAPAKIVIPDTIPDTMTILQQPYDRPYTPLPWDTIKKACSPAYKKILEKAIETGKRAVIEIDWTTPGFLTAFCQANGLNRAPHWDHVGFLAQRFRGIDETDVGFDPSCTHMVTTVDLAVSNAGHSSKALLAAFYPPTPELWEGCLINNESGPVTSQIPGWKDPNAVVADETSEGEDDTTQDALPVPKDPTAPDMDGPKNWLTPEESEAWLARVIAAEKNVATLVVNAPRESVLKMDDVRLQATDVDFLGMVPGIAKTAEEFGITLKDLAQYVRGLYLRTKAPTNVKEKDELVTKYGTLSKGGRLNVTEAPIRAVVFMPMILEAFKVLRSFRDDGKIAFSAMKSTGLISMKDVIVAMAVSSPDARQIIGAALCDPKSEHLDYAKALSDRLTPTEPRSAWSKPSSDWIVTSLVTYGKYYGATDEDGNEYDALESAMGETDWHNPAFRSDGWDIGEPNADGILRDDLLHEVAAVMADITGNPDMLAAVQLKRDRAERAARHAAGDTTRKTRTVRK